MATINPTLPSDGQTIDAADVNTPFNAILGEFNGNIDNDNIKSAANIQGSKLADNSLSGSKFDSTTKGGWLALSSTPNTITYNGNRSYTCVFNSVDLTDTLSEGMRVRLTRTVSAPTQCADLEASSSQYFAKASATGFATGTTWTFKAKIKLESYTTGCIASLDDGTNILAVFINSSGQVQFNGGTIATSDVVTSYQSVPLGRWVDVTASMTIGTPTGEIRIDDVVVSSFVTASAATTFTVATPTLYIGRSSAGNYFDGKICQVAIFNTIVSDATLKTYSSQGMTGSETGCEGYWTLNGVLTDSSSNANTLTAFNSAAATNVDSPFGNYLGGTLEYAVISSKPTFSTNTTVTLQVPEGCAIPTSGGISAVAYSSQDTPYGFPRAEGRWRISTLIRTNDTQSSPTGTTWYNIGPTSGTTGGQSLNIPIGAWKYGYETTPYAGRAGSSNGLGCMSTLSTANNSETNTAMTGRIYLAVNSAVDGAISGFVKRESEVTLDAATTYYLNYRVGAVGSASSIASNQNESGSPLIWATPAYL